MLFKSNTVKGENIMKKFDRRTFMAQTAGKTGYALLAAALPMGIMLTPGRAHGKAKFEVVEGYVLDPDLIHEPKDLNQLTDFEKMHLPILKMPLIAEDGATVPFYALSDHPMEKDHYIESIEIINFNDPLVHKGKINFTPANGTVYFSSQVRAVSGTNQIMAVMKCSKHGRWVGKATVKVTVGGC
ncbi:MAG: hypothetical protein IEMM0002_0571 [bacterium]|nr:MAG: hypothetical protein IEMM0002_0571 [bacterium]